jgi:hypothetical protein
MESKRYSPKEFLRARRPEKFSDSVTEQTPVLDRSILEYQLDSITSRKQEVNFENFAHRLAERTICPNLIPQTGPTGGGDSKVDTETYPVADSLSLIWYEGIGLEAASERWAFAFSAKKQWPAKVRGDVKKIFETRRGYKKAFFISNQFIRDQSRAKIEDELRTKYKLDVRILDRTWILDKIFKNKLELLAIEELGLEISTRRETQKGPLDIERERKLDALEKKIEEAIQQGNYSFNIAKDGLDAAIYSRNLERPRIEIDGRFERAERVAQKGGTPHQILECAYEKAWTTYWWHEDFIKFSELYTSIENLAKNTRNVYELELITNLWFLLYGMTLGDKFPDEVTLFQNRTETLFIELERLSKEENRPSTALQAKTLFLQMQLALKQYKKEPVDKVLNDLQVVIQRAQNLPGYPFEPLVEILTELGEFLEGVPAYEALFETIVKISSAHKGEISAARLLLKRGEQQLSANRPYEAIRSLGRTFTSLYKHESKEDAVFALYLCACAYEQVGLLWAAHGTMLNAASLAINDYWKYGDITPLQAACYSRLKWIELQLGRIPHILAWHEMDKVVRAALVEQGYEKLRLTEMNRVFDGILGMFLLRTDIWDLKQLTKFPDTLEKLDLPYASIALTYSLGHEDELIDDNYRSVWGNEDIKSVFLKMSDQPASEDLPEKPILCNESKIYLKSNLLGCEITLESENCSPCVELAESILAALESLLSTGLLTRMAAREPVLSIVIRKSEFAKQPFEFNLQDETGKPNITFACSPFDPHNMSLEKQGQVKDKLLELVSTIMARSIMIPELDKTLNELLHEEHGLDRSINFTGSFVTIGNVLGYTPKTNLSDWLNPKEKEYHLKRSEPWNADILRKKEETNQETIKPSLAPGGEDIPSDLLNPEKTKHTQMKTVSLIREALWNKAGWHGTAFLVAMDSSTPPILAPTFKDQEAARQIFAQWRSELGVRDESELLRISIVRGINKKKPYWYRVVIGSNPNASLSSSNIRYAVLVNRIHTMEPSSDENLERFIHSYNFFGQYFLAPAIANSDMSSINPFLDYYIAKREIFIKYAWEIGMNDLEGVAIQSDDDPIIPEEEKNPPIIELLKLKREREHAVERIPGRGW